MIRYFGLLFITFFISLRGDNLEVLKQHFPPIINRLSTLEGEFKSIQPFPNPGGSFINAVYLITTTEGKEAVLKVENRYWEMCKTMNEILSIQFLKCRSVIPVPEILHFENTLGNSPISAEYILMRKLSGQPLNHVIDEIRQDSVRYKELLENLADILCQLRKIEFDRLGNFCESNDHLIEGIVDFSQYQCEEPLTCFSRFAYQWLMYTKQEMTKLASAPHPNRQYFLKYIPMIEEWMHSLDLTFLDHPSDRFVLSHQDFVMKNILVDDVQVTGVLDWEWCGSALPEFEAKCGLDFLFSNEDRNLFAEIMCEKGIEDFFKPPPAARQCFYDVMGYFYTLIACYEWHKGKFEHSAKFLNQKLEQRRVKKQVCFDMVAYVHTIEEGLDQTIKQLIQFSKDRL